MNHDSMEVLQQQAEEILELIEDSVSFYCNEECVSGEKVWVMIHTLAECKLKEFPDPDLY